MLIRPRLTDYYGIVVTQEEVDFAIPFLNEDIPLSLDPFLLWKSPSQQDNVLHTGLVNSFNHLGYLVKCGKKDEACNLLISISECEQVGLGFSSTRTGKRFGKKTANDILNLFNSIPQLMSAGFIHFEEIQFMIDNVSKDRISDISCNFLISFLIDYTIDQCYRHKIPMEDTILTSRYDYKNKKIIRDEKVKLPVSPQTKSPVILIPKRWLRAIPWLNFDDYINNYYLKEIVKNQNTADRVSVLNYNRDNYGMVRAYTEIKEKTQTDCKNDPLFSQLPVFSVKRKLSQLAKLPTGMENNNDQKYEELIGSMLPSMLYPHLDFAASQVRTDSGTQIRDLVFYNNRNLPFLSDIYGEYGSKQLVFELKNVKKIERDHINQLNRYLNENFGKFGILVTRNPLSSAMFKNTIDLWSGQRRCIIVLTDDDIKLMSNVFETKQRLPIDVINKKIVEFTRNCPA